VDFSKLRWSVLTSDPDNDRMLRTLRDLLPKLALHPALSPAARALFEDSAIVIPDGATLRRAVDIIAPVHFLSEDADVKGDLFEADKDIIRMAAMNAVLHGFDHSPIVRRDSIGGSEDGSAQEGAQVWPTVPQRFPGPAGEVDEAQDRGRPRLARAGRQDHRQWLQPDARQPRPRRAGEDRPRRTGGDPRLRGREGAADSGDR